MTILPPYIWQLRDDDPDGPNVVILGGTHGDEITGVEIVRDWLKVILPDFEIDPWSSPSGVYNLPGLRGTLTIGLGNPEAVRLVNRKASDGLDLNRTFTKEPRSGPGLTATERRAEELRPILESADELFDIHAVSNKGDLPFVCLGRVEERHQPIISRIPVANILTSPSRGLSGQSDLQTSDECVNRRGGVGICYETGYQDDASKIPQVKRTLVRLLHDFLGVIDIAVAARLLDGVPDADITVPEQKIWTLKEGIPTKMDDPDFVHDFGMFSDDGRLKSWKPIKKGDLYGTYSDGEEVRIPRDGVIVFPTRPDRIEKGEMMVYIAEQIG